MARITTDDRCLIKDIRTKKKWGQNAEKRVLRVFEQQYNLGFMFVIKHYSYFYGFLMDR